MWIAHKWTVDGYAIDSYAIDSYAIDNLRSSLQYFACALTNFGVRYVRLLTTDSELPRFPAEAIRKKPHNQKQGTPFTCSAPKQTASLISEKSLVVIDAF